MRPLWFVALLLCVGVCADVASVDTEDTALLRSGQEFEEFVENATLSAAFSGCGLCQQTGQCDQAYRGQPGQFCIGMASGAPCCCPRDAQCAASPYECRCRRVVPTHHYGGDDYHSQSHSSGISGTFIFFLILLCCCVCCCYLPARRAQQAREQFAYAQPVATSQYGTQAPYAYASAPAGYDSSAYHQSGGGGNTMAAGALGALGGLGAGAALGNMFGGRNNSGYSGDTGGVADNTYTFSGDTGGGDFGGDGGGDYGGDTFGGDS